MSKPKPRITIVGLGLVGASIGMALRRAEVASAVIGHDKETGVNSRAKKLGAVDQTHWRLIPACENSDLVILALPLAAIEPTLSAIAEDLQTGCVVVDCASLKGPVLEWADEILPEDVHFVGGDPIISGPVEGEGGIESASADLFRNGLFCLAPSPKADPDAVKLVVDLVTILGAHSLFLDPLEHDGLMAAVDQLPSLLALALLGAAIDQPSWRELRKAAGPSFDSVTRPAVVDPVDQSELCVANRDNILRWIDLFSASLASLRGSLVESDSEALAQQFGNALKERDKWSHQRAKGQWDEGTQVEMPQKHGIGQAFFGGLWSKRPKRES
jgi:prephenate dehydrogenase